MPQRLRQSAFCGSPRKLYLSLWAFLSLAVFFWTAGPTSEAHDYQSRASEERGELERAKQTAPQGIEEERARRHQNLKGASPDSHTAPYGSRSRYETRHPSVSQIRIPSSPAKQGFAPLTLRILTLFGYLAFGGLGVTVAQRLSMRSMNTTKKALKDVVNASLKTLEAQLPLELWRKKQEQQHQSGEEKQKETNEEEAQKHGQELTKPIALPIPYIVAKLGDMAPESFGFFGKRLVIRDPRLLLDLALDVALDARECDEIFELKQWIVRANDELAGAQKTAAEKEAADKAAAQKAAERDAVQKELGAEKSAGAEQVIAAKTSAEKVATGEKAPVGKASAETPAEGAIRNVFADVLLEVAKRGAAQLSPNVLVDLFVEAIKRRAEELNPSSDPRTKKP